MVTKLNKVEEAVSVRQIANWLGIYSVHTVKLWPWVKEHRSAQRGKYGITMVPLWAIEELVGGPLEPMYTALEIANYLGLCLKHTRLLLRRSGGGITFGHRCVRYPESVVAGIVASRKKKRSSI